MTHPPQATEFYYINYFWFIVKLSCTSLLYLFHQCPPLHTGTNILQRIFLLKVLSLLSSFFVIIQVSAAYVGTGLTSVLYIWISVFLESNCDLKCLFSPKWSISGYKKVCISFWDITVTIHQWTKIRIAVNSFKAVSLLQFWVLAAAIYLVLPSLMTNPTSMLASSSNRKPTFIDARDLPMITMSSA